MVPVQTILFIPLRAKLQALEYRHRWWSPFVDKQLALGFRIQKSLVEPFPRQAAADFRIPRKVIGGVYFKQIFRPMRTCQKCTLEEIVIKGISYLIKQFGTWTPQPCMVERSCCSRCIDLLFDRKVMQAPLTTQLVLWTFFLLFQWNSLMEIMKKITSRHKFLYSQTRND